MTNKSTKKALLLSVLSMLMCVAMLVGTTFAWFTDSVTSGRNTIKAGNLDVVLEYWDKESKTYKPVDSTVALFDDAALWEPGHTEVAYLKVSNAGTLALKYMLSVNVYSETTSETKDGEVIKLSDHLVFSVVEDKAINSEADLYTRETAIEAAGDALGLESYVGGEKELTVEDNTDYVALIIYMPTTVGNEANHATGKTAPSIEMGVELIATQSVEEADFFDNTYDEDAPYGTYIELAAGSDLLAAMASAEKDLPLTIKLKGDVEWPTEGHHGENDITPASSIVIDGNGYTITATGAGVTPLGDQTASMTLKNVTIVDKSVSYNEGAWEFTYLEIGGSSLTCNNVTFADEIQIGTSATFTNCSFESNEESVYAVWVDDGSATFYNCTFTGYRGLKAHEAYGTEISSVIVKDCTFSDITKKPGVVIGDLNADTTVSVTGSTFINCQAGDQGKYIFESDTDVAAFNFTEKDNTVLNNATVVSTKDELLALSAKALTGNNGTAEEAIIVIDADIDMQGAEFSAVIAQRGDKLTVLGNGHKISNVKVVSGENDNTTGMASMFYAYPNSTLTVSDLTLENITVTADANASGYAAAVVGYCEGTAILNNVDVVNATVTGVKSSGMLVGHLSGSLTAKDCDLSGTVTLADFAEEEAGHYAGKYIGTLAGSVELDKCTANVTVSGNLNTANIGEIYGRKTAAGSSNVEFAKDNTALAAAISSGSTNIILGDGTYIIPDSAQGKTLTISGTGNPKDTVIANQNDGSYEGCDYSLDGATVVFENVTINTDGHTYAGYARCNATYNNCVINGSYTLYGESVFNNCTLNVEGDYYNIWTWGGKRVEFNGCTFNTSGKSVLVYNQSCDVYVNDCTFNDSTNGTGFTKSALETGVDGVGPKYNIYINNSTFNGFAENDKCVGYKNIVGNKNSLTNEYLNIVIDGVDVY